MKIINLRNYYPSIYASDKFIEVTDEIANVFAVSKREEEAFRRRKYYNHAQYSIDLNDGIEQHILSKEASVEDTYESENAEKSLYSAFTSLPPIQARRIFAHYFEGLSNSVIARTEGVTEKAIRISIHRGLNNLLKLLKNSL